MALRNTDSGSAEENLANSFSNFVDDIVGFVENLFNNKTRTLDEFAKSSSNEIDKILLKKISEGNEFVAGRFKLIYVDDKNFKFEFETYFKDPKEKDYFHLTGSSKPISMMRLQVNAQSELKREKSITYEIEKPRSGALKVVMGESESTSATPASTSTPEPTISLSDAMNS